MIMRTGKSDSMVSRKGLIEFYEELMNRKKIKKGGAAARRLDSLKIGLKQSANKYYNYRDSLAAAIRRERK
tara:strand:- start:963 stop:1175 length:213 start_codon:yes stop_codon:yes gene_type:complete